MSNRKAKYYIYFNRHKEDWSVKYKGTVISHVKSCWFPKADTIIQAGGYTRFQTTQTRNVHAYIGSFTKPTFKSFTVTDDYHRLYYTPFAASYFSIYEDGEYKEVKRLQDVNFMEDGNVYCKLRP